MSVAFKLIRIGNRMLPALYGHISTADREELRKVCEIKDGFISYYDADRFIIISIPAIEEKE